MEDRRIKCVIWDLDETVWNGVLTEDVSVSIRPEVVKIMRVLDERGILQSISSKNDFGPAWAKLEEFGISELFLYPQINWNQKSDSVKKIVQSINIAFDAVAFVDDQEFERSEVCFQLPQVLCIDSRELDNFLDRDEMNPRFITEDSARRRLLYQSDVKRNQIEETFPGTKEDFLKTLDMKLTIASAREVDLKRAEELTVRTHQLNSTGVIYSFEQLRELIDADDHEVLIIQLDDKYGTYGKIGLVLIEKALSKWELKLLLMSCRVMSRGIGGVLLSYLVNRAAKNDVELFARFIPNDKNRIMYMTYKFGGFVEFEKNEDYILLKADMSKLLEVPDYLVIEEE